MFGLCYLFILQIFIDHVLRGRPQTDLWIVVSGGDPSHLVAACLQGQEWRGTRACHALGMRDFAVKMMENH